MKASQQSALKKRFEQVYLKRRPAVIVKLDEVEIEGRSVFVSSSERVEGQAEQSQFDQLLELMQAIVVENDVSGINSLSEALLAKFRGTLSPGGFYLLARRSERRQELLEILKSAQEVFAQHPASVAIIKQAVTDISFE